ncbi:lipopolysaccharide assembly protein LapB [Flagellimonas sp. CMM7]|uniref:tetratricopeptide repeat protein n=1 Tax=Flagellimonas sp. CMM7 TaxID=2654676 RepID=UPI0013D1DE28|nr:tetratricopeptide repeat protein [Flagellimonas sp. CMM7]UII79080.1 tetratricopeptide repeat protein [Flagellimonas sp. CMM7]
MKYILLFFAAILVVSCQQESSFKTNKKDYNHYLAVEPVKTTSKYFELWNSKIKQDSLQLLSFGNVASEYNRFFQNTGDIQYLKKAEQALSRAVDIAAIGKAGYRRALARNYISQHRFKEALELAKSALDLGSGLKESQSLLFDIHLELGNYNEAEKYLDSIQNMSDFGYLIRLAKWNDHKGDLDTTIRLMEKAANKAESSKNRGLLIWSYTNLADYYGHAGRIDDSYKNYLKALGLDNQNAYAKKGIAWIVFSHERNGKEALRILDAVLEIHKSPDYYLLKAEIAEFIGDELLKTKAYDNYYTMVQNKAYGDMYNSYNIDFYLNELQANDKALELAKIEVENRPTPESYDLLAYSFFKKGEKEKALELVENHIVGKTFEPAILQHAAEIYKANGNKTRVVELKQVLLGAIYELGPTKENQILNL